MLNIRIHELFPIAPAYVQGRNHGRVPLKPHGPVNTRWRKVRYRLFADGVCVANIEETEPGDNDGHWFPMQTGKDECGSGVLSQ